MTPRLQVHKLHTVLTNDMRRLRQTIYSLSQERLRGASPPFPCAFQDLMGAIAVIKSPVNEPPPSQELIVEIPTIGLTLEVLRSIVVVAQSPIEIGDEILEFPLRTSYVDDME